MESPSQHTLPFGYEINGSQGPPPDAPDPAPGNPILDENDNDILASFFSDMNANKFSAPSLVGGGLDVGNHFLDLPAQFMGTATSFGQQDGSSSSVDFGPSYLGDHDPAPGVLLGPPQFVQQAAFAPQATYPMTQQHQEQQYIQQRQAFHPQQQQQQHQQQFSQQRHPQQPMQLLHQQEPYLQQQPPSPLLQRPHYQYDASLVQNPSDEVLNAASLLLNSPAGLGGHNEALPRSRRHPSLSTGQEWQMTPRVPRAPHHRIPAGYQWGSDASFGPSQGFSSQVSKVAAESMQEKQFQVLECLEPSKSTATTRPGSPSGSDHSNQVIANNPELSDVGNNSILKGGSEDVPASLESHEADQIGVSAAQTAATVARYSRKRDETGPRPSRKSGAVTKRRKPPAAAAKPPRQNLTEEEKRRHHILSEQKRRTSIKDAFLRLSRTVPALRGARFSKSNMLRLTANWASELLEGNEELARTLQDP